MAEITPTWTLDADLSWTGLGYSSQGTLYPNDGFVSIYNPFIGKATLDLAAKHGAFIFPRAAKLRGNAWGFAPKIRVYRHPDAAGARVSVSPVQEIDLGTTVRAEANQDGGNSVGDRSFDVFDASGFAAGDMIYIGAPLDSEEWNRIVRIVSNTIHVEFPMRYANPGIAEQFVRNAVTVPAPIWLPGGAFYEIHVVNNLEVIAGGGEDDEDGALRVQIPYQTYDSDTSE